MHVHVFLIRNFGWSGRRKLCFYCKYLYLFFRPCYTGTLNTSPRPVPPAVFPPLSLSVYPRYVCTQYKIKKYAGGIHLLDIWICRGNTPPSYGGRGGGYTSLICKGDTPWCAGGVHSLISWYAGGKGGYTSMICGEIHVLDRRWIHPLDMWWKIHFFNMQRGGGGIHLFNMQGW